LQHRTGTRQQYDVKSYSCVNDCRMAVAQGLDDLLVCYNLATAHAALGDLAVRQPGLATSAPRLAAAC
jgi:hypothetical protein